MKNTRNTYVMVPDESEKNLVTDHAHQFYGYAPRAMIYML